jgi:ZIP family zinc transporter
MSTTQTLILAAIAGGTIFLGLPVARMRSLRIGFRAGMTALATGILIFLLWDVLSGGVEPVEAPLEAHDWGLFALRAALLAGGFTVGLMTLVYYDWWLKCRRKTPMLGSDAGDGSEGHHVSPARQLAILIAAGIGLHNFGEGLAIGQSAAADQVALALVLIIGFGLHNATEGFGITGPLAAEPEPPSWRFLGFLGLIGGGPTFLGTLLGYQWVSEGLQVVFFALAAGSILYVVMELVNVCRRYSMPVITTWMILAGLALGFATDWVLVGAGA